VRLDRAAGGAVVPALVLEPPGGEVSVDGQTLPLPPSHVLAPNERLVGIIGSTSLTVPSFLFPQLSTITVRLDPDTFPRGEPLAWEALDAVVCDGPLPARVDGRVIRALLGSGTVFAVRSAGAQDRSWPWRRAGEWWVLRYDPVGPDSGVAPAAYAPVTADLLGAAPRQRAMVVGIAVVFAIVVLGATLVSRRRWGQAVAVAGVSLLGVAAVAAWSGRQPAVRQQRGAVGVLAGPLGQSDQWTWQIAARAGTATMPFISGQRPMLASARQAQRMGLTLECSGEGMPLRFTATLPANGQIAYLSRTVAPLNGMPTIDPRVDSPVELLVRAAGYLDSPGVDVAGQVPGAAPTDWATVVLERSSKPEVDSTTAPARP
jgi:hypothetical protein